MLVTPRRVHSDRRWRRRPAVGHRITCCSDCYDDFQVSGDTGSSCTDNCCAVYPIGQRDGVTLVPWATLSFPILCYLCRCIKWGGYSDLSRWYPDGDARLQCTMNTRGWKPQTTANCFCIFIS